MKVSSILHLYLRRRDGTATPVTLALLFLLSLSAVSAQEPGTLTWQPAARMDTARTGHCAVGFGEEKVLIAGGDGAEGKLNSTEIYGPGDKFTGGPAMQASRSGHTCTLLADGRILVAGGSAESSAEIWNPETNAWTEATGQSFLNRGHTATLLSDGRVLLAGGEGSEGPTTALALYDPAANEIRVLGANMIDPRSGHVAARLSDGRVLLAGGRGLLSALNSSEFFDPMTERVTPGPAMGKRRVDAGSTTLPDGRVFVAAGTDLITDHGDGELFWEAENRWERIASPMAMPRRYPLVLLLPSGQALIAGGELDGRPVGDTETFDGSRSLFLPVGALTAPRSAIAGALIPGTDRVLATGGAGNDGASALCGVITATTLSIRVPREGSPGEFDSNETVTARGTGWQDSSPVRFSLAADGTSISNRLAVASATPSGGLFNSSFFTTNSSDIGKNFILTATQGTTVASASFRARVRSLIIGAPAATSTVAGSPITINYRLGGTSNVGPMNGTLTFSVGPLSRSITLVSQLPGVDTQHTMCCINTPGVYTYSLRYSGDSRYSAANLAPISPTVTVTAPSLQLSSTLNTLTVLEEATVPVTLGTGASATGSTPAPTGTLTVSGSGLADTVLPLTPSPRGNTSSASFRYRPPLGAFNASFLFRYSGDGNYPTQTLGLIFPVSPARTTLSVVGPPEYTIGEPYSVPVTVRFPAEVVNLPTRQVRVDLIRNTLLLGQFTLPLINVTAGQASAPLQFPVPFETRNLTVTYPGGGDLAASSITIPVQRRPVPTQTVMRLTPTPTLQPITLQVTIDGCPATIDCAVLPSPAGTVRFFDGDVLLAETTVRAGGPGVGSATLGGVVRPAGARQFRAQYMGDTVFAGSTSSSLPVTVQ